MPMHGYALASGRLYRPMAILGLARIVLDPDLVALALRLFAKINYACSMTVPVLRMAIC